MIQNSCNRNCYENFLPDDPVSNISFAYKNQCQSCLNNVLFVLFCWPHFACFSPPTSGVNVHDVVVPPSLVRHHYIRWKKKVKSKHMKMEPFKEISRVQFCSQVTQHPTQCFPVPAAVLIMISLQRNPQLANPKNYHLIYDQFFVVVSAFYCSWVTSLPCNRDTISFLKKYRSKANFVWLNTTDVLK